MADRPFIVGIGGTTRPGSTTERALRLALDRAEAAGARTELIGGAALPVEPYDPARNGRSPLALALVERVREADGLIVATPSYHGSLSGLLKNALDYIEDLRLDTRPYLDDRAVGCIVVAEGPQSMGSTLAALRSIVHALRGWPTPYAACIDSSIPAFPAGGPSDAVAEALDRVAGQVFDFARRMRAAG